MAMSHSWRYKAIFPESIIWFSLDICLLTHQTCKEGRFSQSLWFCDIHHLNGWKCNQAVRLSEIFNLKNMLVWSNSSMNTSSMKHHHISYIRNNIFVDTLNMLDNVRGKYSTVSTSHHLYFNVDTMAKCILFTKCFPVLEAHTNFLIHFFFSPDWKIVRSSKNTQRICVYSDEELD